MNCTHTVVIWLITMAVCNEGSTLRLDSVNLIDRYKLPADMLPRFTIAAYLISTKDFMSISTNAMAVWFDDSNTTIIIKSNNHSAPDRITDG